MEERNNLNNNEWYRPAPAAGEGVTDLFEEARRTLDALHLRVLNALPGLGGGL